MPYQISSKNQPYFCSNLLIIKPAGIAGEIMAVSLNHVFNQVNDFHNKVKQIGDKKVAVLYDIKASVPVMRKIETLWDRVKMWLEVIFSKDLVMKDAKVKALNDMAQWGSCIAQQIRHLNDKLSEDSYVDFFRHYATHQPIIQQIVSTMKTEESAKVLRELDTEDHVKELFTRLEQSLEEIETKIKDRQKTLFAIYSRKPKDVEELEAGAELLALRAACGKNAAVFDEFKRLAGYNDVVLDESSFILEWSMIVDAQKNELAKFDRYTTRDGYETLLKKQEVLERAVGQLRSVMECKILTDNLTVIQQNMRQFIHEQGTQKINMLSEAMEQGQLALTNLREESKRIKAAMERAETKAADIQKKKVIIKEQRVGACQLFASVKIKALNRFAQSAVATDGDRMLVEIVRLLVKELDESKKEVQDQIVVLAKALKFKNPSMVVTFRHSTFIALSCVLRSCGMR